MTNLVLFINMNASFNFTQKRTGLLQSTREFLVLIILNLSNICYRVLDFGNVFLKYRTYVDNSSSVFPLMKEANNAKYIGLESYFVT